MAGKQDKPTEYKTFPFKLTGLDTEGRTLEGYASVFGNLDSVGDIVHQGAFRKTLEQRGDRVKFLWQHDPKEPIGRPLEMSEDDRGLFIKAIISDTARGRDALALLRDQAIGELSIGYDAIKGGTEYSKDDDGNEIRNLKELRLYEFSLVTFAANEEAQVTALKEDPAPSEEKPAPEVTENTIRIRVRNPGDFEEDSIRTIAIGGKDSGIQATTGRLKDGGAMAIQAYIFAKDKFSVEEAQAWVDEHKKDAVPDLDEKQMDEDEAGDLVPVEQGQRYECVECGYQMVAEEKPKECPKCGGEMKPVKAGEEPDERKFTGSPRNPYGTHASQGYPGGRDSWKQAWRIHLSGVRDQGPVQGTVRRVSMIAAGMKPPCKIPEMSSEDLGPRPGKCGKLAGTYKETPGDYGLSAWKKPSDDDLEQEDIQLTCQDLADLKRICLQEIAKRAACKDEGKSDWESSDSQIENKDDRVWLWEVSAAIGVGDVTPPWETSTEPETKEVPEAVVFASIALQSVLAKLDQESWEYKAAELAIGKLRGLYGELAPDLVAELETKAGRVLAARNAQRIGAALASLIEVLKDAGIDVPGVGREMPADEEAEEEEKDYGLEIEALETELGLLEMEGDTRVW